MSLVDACDGWIVDLDGVVWIGERLLPGAAEGIARLRGEGRSVVFLTNDPRSSAATFAQRLTSGGVPAEPEQVITSSAALAALLRERERGRSAYAIGSPALQRQLAGAGLELVGDSEEADLVAVGGHDGFDYEELRIALGALERGAALYATNRDPTYPAPDGPRPGTGAILAAVEAAARRRAVVAGKPEPYIFELARSKLPGCREIVVVGDSLSSDIAGGRRAGMATVLVLGGSTKPEQLAESEIRPDHVVPSLGALAGE